MIADLLIAAEIISMQRVLDACTGHVTGPAAGAESRFPDEIASARADEAGLSLLRAGKLPLSVGLCYVREANLKAVALLDLGSLKRAPV